MIRYTPQQNGVAENMNKIKRARSTRYLVQNEQRDSEEILAALHDK